MICAQDSNINVVASWDVDEINQEPITNFSRSILSEKAIGIYSLRDYIKGSLIIRVYLRENDKSNKDLHVAYCIIWKFFKVIPNEHGNWVFCESFKIIMYGVLLIRLLWWSSRCKRMLLRWCLWKTVIAYIFIKGSYVPNFMTTVRWNAGFNFRYTIPSKQLRWKYLTAKELQFHEESFKNELTPYHLHFSFVFF